MVSFSSFSLCKWYILLNSSSRSMVSSSRVEEFSVPTPTIPRLKVAPLGRLICWPTVLLSSLVVPSVCNVTSLLSSTFSAICSFDIKWPSSALLRTVCTHGRSASLKFGQRVVFQLSEPLVCTCRQWHPLLPVDGSMFFWRSLWTHCVPFSESLVFDSQNLHIGILQFQTDVCHLQVCHNVSFKF